MYTYAPEVSWSGCAPEVLGGIYGRQAAVRELLDGAWVHLVSVHPETAGSMVQR